MLYPTELRGLERSLGALARACGPRDRFYRLAALLWRGAPVTARAALHTPPQQRGYRAGAEAWLR